MKIIGESYQDGVPSPENPVEIKNEKYIIVHIDGKETKIPYTEDFENVLAGIELKDGDYIALFNPRLKAELDELGS